MENLLNGLVWGEDDYSEFCKDIFFPVWISGSLHSCQIASLIIWVWFGYHTMLPFEFDILELVAKIFATEAILKVSWFS